jgi:hypothetical protein
MLTERQHVPAKAGIDPELIRLYRQALADNFPITRYPPAHWRLECKPSAFRIELALMVEELVEVTHGLCIASGAATVARSYKRLARRITLAAVNLAA